ncbi:hypothetical protein HYPSUDRAFT_76582 [Hypholoma sublateritium FD-334 SS-4]|uniref:F-box domain-containing protein n=1 Tax=Hypholoma sublateritium (strain FD-334 SS-4) TaxID=945553 RepID=A0A0D2LAN5_HYPSF|nr:hypothetical protein HYPSUDRAFT_76582 [Hypholoma sublateritium FD-334 SS-4]
MSQSDSHGVKPSSSRITFIPFSAQPLNKPSHSANIGERNMAIPVTGISDVPTETLEIILDFLHDDSSALYSSSLVVRNWLPSPRYHLFNRILLNEVEQWGGRVLQANVRSFLTLIRAEHCTFLSYVQCIVLNVTTQTLIDEVVNALVPLKKLSQIVLMHHRPRTNRDHASGRLIAWNGRFLHNVRDFTVNALTDFGYDAWALVASFANLRSLAIYIPERIPFVLPSPPHIPPSTFRNLRTLRLQLKGSEELLTWMQAGDGEYCALETFDLWLYSPSRRGWGPVTTLNSFLKNISDTLRHLGIGIVDYDTMADDSVHHGQHIDLGPLNLESLFLSTHDIGAVCDTLESVGTSLELEALTSEDGPKVQLRLTTTHRKAGEHFRTPTAQ